MKISPLLYAAIALPILGLVGGALFAWQQGAQGSSWDVPVRGYDPRDLLRGHYVQFQYEGDVAPGTQSPAPIDSKDWALCLSGPSNAPRVQFVHHEAALSCRAVGKEFTGHEGLRFRNIGEGGAPLAYGRFFVPEEDALLLDTLLRDPDLKIRVTITVTDKGQVTPRDILIEGVPYHLALKTRQLPASVSRP